LDKLFMCCEEVTKSQVSPMMTTSNTVKLQMQKYLCHVCNNVVVDLFLPNLLEIIHPSSFGHAEPEVPIVVE
jgi:hypothetical protein